MNVTLTDIFSLQTRQDLLFTIAGQATPSEFNAFLLGAKEHVLQRDRNGQINAEERQSADKKIAPIIEEHYETLLTEETAATAIKILNDLSLNHSIEALGKAAKKKSFNLDAPVQACMQEEHFNDGIMISLAHSLTAQTLSQYAIKNMGDSTSYPSQVIYTAVCTNKDLFNRESAIAATAMENSTGHSNIELPSLIRDFFSGKGLWEPEEIPVTDGFVSYKLPSTLACR